MNRNVKLALLVIAIVVVVVIIAGQMRRAYSLGQKSGGKAGAPAVLLAAPDRIVIE